MEPNKLGLGKILDLVGNESDLNETNVIEKIKNKLQEKDPSVYRKWENNLFDINYLFTIQDGYPELNNNVVTLLYVSTAINSTNLVEALLELEGINISKGSGVTSVNVERTIFTMTPNVERTIFTMTPLQLAAKEGHEKVAELLIGKGADVELTPAFLKENNPICVAVKNGHIELAKFLVNEVIKTDVELSPAFLKEDNPICLAVKNGHTELVKFLVNAVIKADKDVKTYLYWAVKNGYAKAVDCIVECLLDEKVDIDSIDDKRNNLLHYVANCCSEETILTLITKGVDPWLENNNGKTPVDIYVSKHRGSEYLMQLKRAENGSATVHDVVKLLGRIAVVSLFVTAIMMPEILSLCIIGAVVFISVTPILVLISKPIAYEALKPKIGEIKKAQSLDITNTMKEKNDKKKLANLETIKKHRFITGSQYEQKSEDLIKLVNQEDLIKLVNQDEKATLNDVIITDELKKELKVICSKMSEKEQEVMERLKCKLPKGYIFYGPPGTGKTLLARAIAGENNSAFISISGSELIGKYAGQGVYHVRDLFKRARENAPCIIFIDEIDAIGAKRVSCDTGSGRDHNATLNQLLTEIDGFKKNKDIVVIAATNRPDVLDPALARRLPKKIHIPLPDESSRIKILKLYLNSIPVKEDLNLEDLTNKIKGFSGADIENLVEAAKLHAIDRAKNEDTVELTMLDFENALSKISESKLESEQVSSNVNITTLNTLFSVLQSTPGISHACTAS